MIAAGKLVIPTRVAFVVVLWTLKLAVLDLLRTMLRRLRHERPILTYIYTIMLLSFAFSILAVFLECRPLGLYWSLHPDAHSW